MMEILCALLLTALIVGMICLPHVRAGSHAGSGQESHEDSQLGAARLLRDAQSRHEQMLQDLELDFKTGKIEQRDYDELRAETSKALEDVEHRMRQV